MGNFNGILMLCVRDASSAAILNTLRTQFGDPVVVIEQREAKSVFIKRRLRKLGVFEVVGQLLFMAVAAPLVGMRAAARLEDIRASAKLDLRWPDDIQVYNVGTVNNSATADLIEKYKPKLVIVNGTRIIAPRVIAQCACPMINIHCGITPKYRGVHGGYWALAERDAANCGVTVHLVSAGVDTGDILAQRIVKPTRQDNFATYPLLQLSAALTDLPKIVSDGLAGKLGPTEASGESRQWFHPTLWGYVWRGFTRRVW